MHGCPRAMCDDVSSDGAPTDLGGVSTSRKHSQGGSRAWSMGVLRYTRSEEDSCTVAWHVDVGHDGATPA